MREILSGKYFVTSAAPFAFWALLIKFWYNIISSAGKKCNTKRKEKYMFGIVPSIFQPISFVTKGEKTLLVYDFMLHIRSTFIYHYNVSIKRDLQNMLSFNFLWHRNLLYTLALFCFWSISKYPRENGSREEGQDNQKAKELPWHHQL